MGIKHLLNLEKVLLRYSQWNASNNGVKTTVAAMKTEAKEHKNRITLCIAEENKDGSCSTTTKIIEENGNASCSMTTEIEAEEDGYAEAGHIQNNYASRESSHKEVYCPYLVASERGAEEEASMESGGAVSVTTGVAGPLIAKLTTLLGDDMKQGVRRDIMFLKNEWSSINAHLIDLAAGVLEDYMHNTWMRELWEMTFHMDDSIDLVLAGGFAPNSARARCLQMLRLPAVLDSGYQMATLMKQSKYMLAEVIDAYARHMAHGASPPSRLVARYDIVHDNVGTDSQRQELTQLIYGDGQLKVISVVGLAGLGKTTLANLVYRTLAEQFECCALASASQDPDMKKILLSLLFQVGATENDDSRSEWDLSRLVYTLREFLSSKRYFIVIDDLWSSLAWRTIKSALPENDLGSRILTTTQIISVAKSCCHPNGNLVYEMKPLSDDDARILLFRTVFGNEDSCPSELEEVAADIVKKCGGSPLAISSISTLLVTEDLPARKEKWFRIRDSVQLGFPHRGLDVYEMRSLLISYMELPLQLRTCLLYLIMFPEDYIIHRDRLIKRWIAEGFISAKRGQSLQKVGEWYFSELINRKMIQPLNNQADACIVRSTILDLIAHISTEENFVTLYAGNNEDTFSAYEVRRLIIDNRGQRCSMPPSGDWTYKVRSLGIFGSVSGMPPISDFGALRVLDIEIDGELERNYLEDIAHLFHLKYLRLQTTSNVELVKIAKLQYLETLDLTGAPISVLPANIVQLKRLKHLLVNDVKLPDGIRNMQCLSELSRVKVPSSNSTYTLEELGSLTKLRVLGLNWCISDTDDQMETYVDNLVSSLNGLSRCNLQSLRMASNDGCSMDFLVDSWLPPSLQEFQMNTKYCLPRIPEWMASHCNIAFLDINIDSVEQQVLQILGALPALLVLLLASKKSPSPGLGLRIGSEEFYCLQRFNFTCWNSWGVVMFEPGAMPQLKTLELVFSAKGRFAHDGSDFGIENLTFLKHLCVKVNARDATALEVEAAEAAIQRAADQLPYHPTTEVTRWNEEHVLKETESEDYVEEVDYEEDYGA